MRNENWLESNPRKTIGIIVTVLLITADLTAGAIFIPERQDSIRTFHSYYHHGFKKNQYAVEKWGANRSYEIYTDSLGLRHDGNHAVPLTPNGKRFIFIGDSFTEGVGVSFRDTFVGIVHDALGKRGYDVLCAGVSSYGTGTYYLKIKYLIEQEGLKFDELFVFIDISDIYNDLSLEEFEQFTPRNEEGSVRAVFRTAKHALSDISYVYFSLNIIYPYVKYRKFERSFPWWTIKGDVFNDWASRGLSLSLKNMNKLVDLCRQRGIAVTIAVYPWTNLIEARDMNSKQVTYWAEFAKSTGCRFINYFPDFINETPAKVINDRYFIPGDIHWNEEGHKLIAGKVLKFIQ